MKHRAEHYSIEQFNAWSKSFERMPLQPFHRANSAIVRALNPIEGSSLLDVGCGTGILLEQLARLGRGLDLHGMDISTGMVALARAKLGGAASVVQASASELPYGARSFNYVTCATSFHHYPYPQQSLCEMYRVLKGGGTLIVLDPFTDGPLRKFMCFVLNAVFGEHGVQLFARERIWRMFREAGFDKVEQTTYLYYKLMTVGVRGFRNVGFVMKV